MNVSTSSGEDTVGLDRVEYFWGLFRSAREIQQSEAKIQGAFVGPAIPDAILESFTAERMAELSGEFGDPNVGQPTEVDFLAVSCGGKVTTIRVFNRGIALLTETVPEIKRLHRFFCTVQRCIGL